MNVFAIWRALPAIALVMAVAGASGCGASGTPTGPTINSISLGLSSSTGVAAQSGTIQFTAVVGRTGDSRSDVSFSLDNAPAGVTDSVASVHTSSNGTTTALITLYVDPLTPADAYLLTLRAKADSVADATATFALTVIPLGAGTFTILADAITISLGESGLVPITIVRLGFPGLIRLSVLDLPASVSAFLSPTQSTGTVASLSLTVGIAAQLGEYDVTIRGTGSGLDIRKTIRLTIQ